MYGATANNQLTINPKDRKKCLLWDFDPSPSLPSRTYTYALPVLIAYWCVDSKMKIDTHDQPKLKFCDKTPCIHKFHGKTFPTEEDKAHVQQTDGRHTNVCPLHMHLPLLAHLHGPLSFSTQKTFGVASQVPHSRQQATECHLRQPPGGGLHVCGWWLVVMAKEEEDLEEVTYHKCENFRGQNISSVKISKG